MMIATPAAAPVACRAGAGTHLRGGSLRNVSGAKTLHPRGRSGVAACAKPTWLAVRRRERGDGLVAAAGMAGMAGTARTVGTAGRMGTVGRAGTGPGAAGTRGGMSVVGLGMGLGMRATSTSSTESRRRQHFHFRAGNTAARSAAESTPQTSIDSSGGGGLSGGGEGGGGGGGGGPEIILYKQRWVQLVGWALFVRHATFFCSIKKHGALVDDIRYMGYVAYLTYGTPRQ